MSNFTTEVIAKKFSLAITTVWRWLPKHRACELHARTGSLICHTFNNHARHCLTPLPSDNPVTLRSRLYIHCTASVRVLRGRGGVVTVSSSPVNKPGGVSGCPPSQLSLTSAPRFPCKSRYVEIIPCLHQSSVSSAPAIYVNIHLR